LDHILLPHCPFDIVLSGEFFLVAWPLCFFKNSQATWSREKFEIKKNKSPHLKEKNVLKLPRFLKD
jgi:hypothetical protein